MKYENLTINQKISLKGFFYTEKSLANYKVAMVMFGFKKAINFFLNDNINELN